MRTNSKNEDKMTEREQILFESTETLRAWLLENHSQEQSIWLVRWKRESAMPSVSYDEIVDELICFGWVDSLPRKLNDRQSMLLISPRKPTSNWSAVNKVRVNRMIQAKKMHASGMKSVAAAKKNGAWNFLDDVEKLIIPDDLKEALQATEKAAHYFNRFPPSSKRGILEWIKNAKTPVTRAKRILETANKAALNRKANHPKGRDRGPKEP